MLKIKKPLSQAQLKQRRDAAKQANKNKTGPTTEKGKAVSAMNAWKDGSTAQSVRSSIIGKPCKSTCVKYPCVFVTENKTAPGGKCLDVADWQIIEESTEAIVEAQQGKPEKLQHLASMLMGMNVSVIQQLFADIQAHGVRITSDVINKDGEVVGQKDAENPMIALMSKMIANQGISLPEFLATPQSQAKVSTDEGAQQTAAEFTRQMSRLLPPAMAVPQFSDSEVVDADVVDADVVED